MSSPAIIRSATQSDADVVSEVYLASRTHFWPSAPLAHAGENRRDCVASHFLSKAEVSVAILDGDVVGIVALDRDATVGCNAQWRSTPVVGRY